jgi:hypothetical protein
MPMNNEQLTAATLTVVDLSQSLADLKARALAIYDPAAVAARGYITPSEEIQVRQLQLSYWNARNALYELLYEIWRDTERIERATAQEFLIALAAAALLVDAARFLRETFHRPNVVRRKLDEPDPVYGFPPRMYDDIQTSLTSSYHAWHLWNATRYFDRHRATLAAAARECDLEPIVEIIDRLRDRLRPSLWTYLRTRTQVRGRRAARCIGRDVLGRALYGVQEAVGRGLAEVRMKPSHLPSLPKRIRAELVELLRPGDVLVVRKEFAATNYLLPGYWPHVALFVGTGSGLVDHGLANHPHIEPRLPRLRSATEVTAVLTPDPINTWSNGAEHPCVLEAMKDGVRIRSVNSAFNSDSIVVVRPTLEECHVASALAQAFMHEGKPYDFDFDFCASHRLVCTEVVYRAYDGVAGIKFDLRRHAGRFALAAGDLLRMALENNSFRIVAVYSAPHSPSLQLGAAAAEIVARVENPQRAGLLDTRRREASPPPTTT